MNGLRLGVNIDHVATLRQARYAGASHELRAEPELASPHFDEQAYQVEMEPAAPAVNALLTSVGKVEASLLRQVSLPFGTSVIAIAEKIN